MADRTAEERARELYEIALANGVVNDMRHWDQRSGEKDGWEWNIPALPEYEKEKWRRVAAAIRSREADDAE